jgi:hypothetical protein
MLLPVLILAMASFIPASHARESVADEVNLATVEIVTKSGTGFSIPGFMVAPGDL